MITEAYKVLRMKWIAYWYMDPTDMDAMIDAMRIAAEESKNKEVFGSCYSPHGHGHNYVLEAYISGPIQEDTGMIINLRDIDQFLLRVTQNLDHKFLNTDVPEFAVKVPTTENIAQYCFEQLKPYIPAPLTLEKVRLRDQFGKAQ